MYLMRAVWLLIMSVFLLYFPDLLSTLNNFIVVMCHTYTKLALQAAEGDTSTRP